MFGLATYSNSTYPKTLGVRRKVKTSKSDDLDTIFDVNTLYDGRLWRIQTVTKNYTFQKSYFETFFMINSILFLNISEDKG